MSWAFPRAKDMLQLVRNYFISTTWICSITLHVNLKIAIFVNFQVLTMAKMDTKVKNQVLTNILYCSVDRKMVL